MTLEAYARRQVAALLERLEEQIARSQNEHDPEAIHDLRVAIRRLTQALRAFRSLFDRKAVKRVRRETRTLMEIAAEVRDRDIALELHRSAGATEVSTLWRELSAERDKLRRRLAESRPVTAESFRRWRSELGL